MAFAAFNTLVSIPIFSDIDNVFHSIHLDVSARYAWFEEARKQAQVPTLQQWVHESVPS